MKEKIFFCLFFFYSFFVTAQIDKNEQSSDDLFDLSIEELMDMHISVSTKSSASIRETPGIVSIITSKDIENSGARDMVDLIQRYVPGFEFGTEVEGLVGLGIRGVWSLHGKLLLLMDGVEVNENMFGLSVFGHKFSLNNIESIEIVRGSGSVIYGGYASMGVINIITKESDVSSGDVSYLASHTGQSFSHNALSFSNRFVKNDLKISVFADFINGTRSDRGLKGVLGDSRTMSGNSNMKARNSGVKIKYKKFNMSAVILDYGYETIDLWDSIVKKNPLKQNFSDFLSQASYTFDLSEYIKIIPKLTYNWHKPLNMDALDYNYINTKESDKLIAGVMGTYTKNIFEILGGVDYNYESIKQSDYIHPAEEVFKDGSKNLEYNSFNIYGQVGLNTKYGNLIAGMRFDKSELFGHAFAPRIGITKAFEKFHLKVSVNKAFRAPGGLLSNRQNIGDPKIMPEEAFTYEFEVGVKLPAHIYMTVNLFNTDFKKVIIYETNASGIGLYKNGGKLGTYGFEATVRHNSDKLSAELNFAYYQRKKSDNDAAVRVSLDEKHFLSFSPITMNAVISYKIINNLRITPSISFLGHKYAYTYMDKGNLSLEKINPQTLLNVNVTYFDLFVEGFDVSIAGNNLLGTDFKYYTGTRYAHSPIPSLDRSIQLKLSYKY